MQCEQKHKGSGRKSRHTEGGLFDTGTRLADHESNCTEAIIICPYRRKTSQ